MKEAIFENELNCIKISIKEFKSDMRGKLKCKNECCNTKITYVGEYKRQFNEKCIIVAPFFRLSNGSTHAPGCSYNTKDCVNIIARDSDADLLNSIEENKYSFRLHLITESLDSIIKTSEKKAANNSQLREDQIKEKKFRTKGNLDSYLSTTRKIMQLRSMIDDKKELKNLITLDLHGFKIDWDHLYYDTEKFSDCYYYAKKLKAHKHPICLEGQIRKIIKPSKSYEYYKIILESPRPNFEDKVRSYYVVNLNIKNEKVLNYIVENEDKEFIAVYSMLRTHESDINEKNGVKYKYYNIYGDILHRDQIYFFNS